MTLSPPVPVLRILDEAAARAFYIDYLGFRLDWEFRMDTTAPIYMQVSRESPPARSIRS